MLTVGSRSWTDFIGSCTSTTAELQLPLAKSRSWPITTTFSSSVSVNVYFPLQGLHYLNCSRFFKRFFQNCQISGDSLKILFKNFGDLMIPEWSKTANWNLKCLTVSTEILLGFWRTLYDSSKVSFKILVHFSQILFKNFRYLMIKTSNWNLKYLPVFAEILLGFWRTLRDSWQLSLTAVATFDSTLVCCQWPQKVDSLLNGSSVTDPSA